jgi:pimeloyl-ACP methyl ester carboxylesterase
MAAATFTVATQDGHLVHGILNCAADKPGQKAVVIAHGFACSQHEYLYEAAQRYFNAQGYDVIRFGFYGAGEKARRLEQCDLTTHAKDLNTVLDHFSPQYGALYLAGHSFGGLTALIANPENVCAVSFWDTTLYPDTRFAEEDVTFEPSLQAYHYRSFIDVLVGPAMVHEANNLDEGKLNALAAQFKKPAQFLFAGDGTVRSHEDAFFAAIPGAKERAIIQGADHFFTNGNSAEQLLSQSLAWFERFSQPAPVPARKPPDIQP